MAFDERFLVSRINQSAEAVVSLLAQVPLIARIAGALRTCLEGGGTIYTCGNGGSAAEALHLAEEFVGKYAAERPPLRAVCLNADPTSLTCIANDFGFEEVFARPVRALVSERDVLVGYTTSGNSPNVRLAMEAARAKGATTIAMLGKGGGACKGLADHALIVDHADTAMIQQAHQVVTHLLLEAFEPR